MERCPNCRAREPGDGPCRRCGMELAPLQGVEAAADRLIHCALLLLVQGEPAVTAAVQQILAQAQALHRDPLVALLQGFTGAMRRR